MADRLYSAAQVNASRAVLDQLHQQLPEAVLIGGWGTWLRVQAEMSHDIDLITSHAERELVASLAAGSMSASQHLGGRKWRAEVSGIHVDLYVNHESRLGQRLQLRVEDLSRSGERLGGWRVLTLEAHCATKLAALLDRPESMPGEKDRRELRDLMATANPALLGQQLLASSQLGTSALEAAVAEGYDLLGDVLNKAERRKAHRWCAATIAQLQTP